MTAHVSFTVRTRTSVTCGAARGAVWDTVADLPSHLIWSGERAADDTFKLLEQLCNLAGLAGERARDTREAGDEAAPERPT